MQILLDEERYVRLERAAAASGRSVAALVREAIDRHFSTDVARRSAAGQRLLAEFSAGAGREPEWSESKDALLADLDGKLP
jgi:predicted RNA-binding Zn ribbon-like protein